MFVPWQLLLSVGKVCNIPEDSTLLLLAVNHYVLYLQIDGLNWRYRFASLAGRMENLIQENSRDMVDQAYMKLVRTMFPFLYDVQLIDASMCRMKCLFRQLHEWCQVGCSPLNIPLVEYLLPFPSYGLSLHKPGIYACSSRTQVIMQDSSSTHWVMWLSCKLQLLSSEISGVRCWSDWWICN